MKSVGIIGLGFAAQVVVTLAFMGFARSNPDISGYALGKVLIGTLAVIGLAATISAGILAPVRGRLWAVGASGIFFSAVVFFMAGSLYSLHENQ